MCKKSSNLSERLMAALANIREPEALQLAADMLKAGHDPMQIIEIGREADSYSTAALVFRTNPNRKTFWPCRDL